MRLIVDKRERVSEEQERVQELITIAQQLTPKLLEFTTPLCQLDANGKPFLVGSSVLLQLGSARFLITAGHVLDMQAQAPLVAAVSPEMWVVAGDLSRLRTTGSGKGADDTIDIGIV